MRGSKFISFRDAKKYVRALNFKDARMYREWCKTERPDFIPSAPEKNYKDDGWSTWMDWLGNDNVRFNRKHCVNDSFFKKWNRDMAYILGFWWADGHLNKRGDKSYRFFLYQKESGKELLEKIKRVMESSYPIYRNKSRKYPDKKYFSFIVASYEIAKDIMRLGGSTQKSHSGKTPVVPEEFMSDFMRGYFDGDGSVFECRGQLVIDIVICNKTFANFIFSLVKEVVPDAKVNLTQRPTGYFDIKLYSTNAIKFCTEIYNNESDLFLTRKKEVFLKHMEGRNEH